MFESRLTTTQNKKVREGLDDGEGGEGGEI
jgi:hypothetical protein